MKIVIADAGPLIALSRIDQLQLLQQLFQEVVITENIRDEILVNDHSLGKETIEKAINSKWINVKKVKLKTWQPLNPGVDAGESSAIFLATQAPESTLLIMDDQAGRAEARYQKLAVIGTAAVIGMAKEQKYIDSAKSVLHQLRDAGYYIGDAIIETVLKDIGEE
jgi:predicted nucleic acid-binding protein